MAELWIALEREASQKNQRTYIDPQSGYRVFTSYGLQQRGDCCGCGCRHCPFGHKRVSSERRKKLRKTPWLEGELLPSTNFDVVSWSGGKDSYLALRMLQKQNSRPILLMTTFDGRTENVAHQDVLLSMIQEQARTLKLPLLLIPLYSEKPYLASIEQGLDLLSQHHLIHRLVFGDLHLEYIRAWREKELEPLMKKYNFVLHFPLWNCDYDMLLGELQASKAQCRISAIANEECKKTISIGDVFDEGLMLRLPLDVDKFGEKGEFHTYISIA